MSSRRKVAAVTKLKTLSKTVGDVTFTVREPVGMDLIDSRVVISALEYDRDKLRLRERAMRFTEAVIRTESVSGLPFAWATVDSEAAALNAAFMGWQALDAALIRAWDDALYEVDPRFSLGN